MEWGAEVSRDCSGWLAVGWLAVGWLAVADCCDGASEVTVHPNFGERSVEPEMREQAPGDRDDPLAEDISATLESIRRQIEEGACKVEPSPSPVAELPTG